MLGVFQTGCFIHVLYPHLQVTPLYEVPVAAEANCCKLRALKPHKLFL